MTDGHHQLFHPFRNAQGKKYSGKWWTTCFYCNESTKMQTLGAVYPCCEQGFILGGGGGGNWPHPPPPPHCPTWILSATPLGFEKKNIDLSWSY